MNVHYYTHLKVGKSNNDFDGNCGLCLSNFLGQKDKIESVYDQRKASGRSRDCGAVASKY